MAFRCLRNRTTLPASQSRQAPRSTPAAAAARLIVQPIVRRLARRCSADRNSSLVSDRLAGRERMAKRQRGYAARWPSRSHWKSGTVGAPSESSRDPR